MRLYLFIGVLFVSGLSFSQTIEASASVYGFGNYSPSGNTSETRFQDLSFSPMASVMYRQNWLNLSDDRIQLSAGLGLSFTQYSGAWEETFEDRLVGGNVVESFELYQYSATMNALGLEMTPLIVSFWDLFEVRSGLFLGTNLTDTYSEKYGRSWTTEENGVVIVNDGALEEVPVSFEPKVVLHWNSRVALNFHIKQFSIAPFYQYSRALTKEGESESIPNIKSYRNHFGFTFGYQLKP
ncbi:MAG: hypothetical protein Crog4KO_07290 [Crocinitomicaceae bacterium]